MFGEAEEPDDDDDAEEEDEDEEAAGESEGLGEAAAPCNLANRFMRIYKFLVKNIHLPYIKT